MSLQLEIALAIALGAFLLTIGFGLPLIAFVLYPWLHRRAYDALFPVRVPGWTTRLEGHPPFDATVDDFALMNRKILETAVSVKGYARSEVKAAINRIRVRYVRRDEHVMETWGTDKRPLDQHIVDPWGRQHPTEGRPLFVSGWHEGDTVYLVWGPRKTLAEIVYAHEMGHELHEIEGVVDMDHEDDEMWQEYEKLVIQSFLGAKARGETR